MIDREEEGEDGIAKSKEAKKDLLPSGLLGHSGEFLHFRGASAHPIAIGTCSFGARDGLHQQHRKKFCGLTHMTTSND